MTMHCAIFHVIQCCVFEEGIFPYVNLIDSVPSEIGKVCTEFLVPCHVNVPELICSSAL